MGPLVTYGIQNSIHSSFYPYTHIDYTPRNACPLFNLLVCSFQVGHPGTVYKIIRINYFVLDGLKEFCSLQIFETTNSPSEDHTDELQSNSNAKSTLITALVPVFSPQGYKAQDYDVILTFHQFWNTVKPAKQKPLCGTCN